ncbi:MAG: hypothetical protein IT250_18465 [Chitinophagaceae bacterium]|nr:hypothetical protein [Chitinophagaceae bacterium]
MKACCLILPILIACAASNRSFAQTTDTLSVQYRAAAFSSSVTKKTEQLNAQFSRKSEKALRRYKKYQASILKKLSKVDTIAARNFSIVSAQKYQELQDKMAVPGSLRRYIPSLDTLTSSLNFLKQSSVVGQNIGNANAAIASVKGLTERIRSGDNIKEYLREEKGYIKDQLERFGLTKELKKINKNLYYYSEELIELKETLNDANKIERKVISLLSQTRAFQQFLQKNGMLAGIFPSADPGTDPGTADIAGLQTRTGFNQLIQNQVAAGGPTAQSVIRENFQQGQEQLQQLKNKLTEFGSRGSEDIMPDGFVPNNQRARSFLKRLELNTNMQSQRASNYLPTATDFGLGVGYRLSGGAVIGVGASYRAGWGQSIQHIKVSHQGVGIRMGDFWYQATRYSQQKQIVGGVGFKVGKLSVTFEDEYPFGDQKDRYRTTGLMFSYAVDSKTSSVAGLSIYTGEPDKTGREKGSLTPYNEVGGLTYRNGVAFGGVVTGGKAYMAGWNSEGLRNVVQNGFHDLMGKPPLKWFLGGASPHFPVMPYAAKPYTYFGTLPSYALPS